MKLQINVKSILALLTLTLLTPLVWASDKGEVINITKSPNDMRQYRAITLDNELEVLMVSDSETDMSAAALSVGVGFLFDPLSQQGMAHYLEHMLFLGTEKFPDTAEYAQFIDSNGGSDNAYTWTDVTNYMFSIKNAAYDEALDRFSDFFKAPKLYPEYTQKEINAVNAEWSMRREMDFFGQFKLKRSFMGSHPANRFLIGNLETLGDKEDSKLHPETVEFYNKYYSANIMKAVLLSNLPLDEMEKLARKHFSSIENKKIAKPQVTESLPAFGKKRVYYVPNNDVKQIVLDFTINNNLSDFRYKPNNYVSYLLGSEMPGTPAFILKEQGLISSLSGGASANLYGNYGNFSVTISLTDKGMEQREFIVATVMQYLNMIREEGVDEKYFKEIQTSLSNTFRFLEKTDEFNYVSNLAHNMQDYPIQHVLDSPYYYSQFNSEAIQAVLDQMVPENMLVWYISKQEKTDQEMHFYAGKYRTEALSDAEIDSWNKPSKLALALPDVNRLLPENFELFTEASTEGQTPEKAYDHEGVEIWNFASQYFAHQPKGLLQVHINNPANQSDIRAEVMLNVWASLFNLQQSALATEASIAGMNLSLSATNGLTVNISGFTDKQDILLKEAFEKLVVDVNEENFAQAIDRYVRGIRNSEKQFAYYQVFSAFNGVRSSGSYDNEDLIKTAQSLSHTDFKQFMKSVMDNNTVRTFTYGNYSKQDIAALAERIESMLPDDRRETEYVMTRYWQPQPGKTLVYRADIPVEDVAVIDMYVHPQPGYEAKAAAGILQIHYHREAFNTLRTEEQLAYAIQAYNTSIDQYAAIGLAIQTPVKNAKDMQIRFNEFNKTYAKALENLTDEEFQTLKAGQLTSLKEKPKNLSEEVSPLLSDWTRERYDFDSQQQLIAATEKVTLDDLKGFFKQTIGNKKAARISVQLRGKKYADQPYFEFDNEVAIDDLAKFHATTKHQGTSSE